MSEQAYPVRKRDKSEICKNHSREGWGQGPETDIIRMFTGSGDKSSHIFGNAPMMRLLLSRGKEGLNTSSPPLCNTLFLSTSNRALCSLDGRTHLECICFLISRVLHTLVFTSTTATSCFLPWSERCASFDSWWLCRCVCHHCPSHVALCVIFSECRPLEWMNVYSR